MKRINFVCLLIGCSIFLLSCHQKDTAITIAAPVGPADGPVYVAYEKGYFAKEGLQVNLVPLSSGRLALDALLGGKAEIAMVAETPLALAAFQQKGFGIICTVTRSPHKLVARQAIISSPQDIKGKRVAALAGSAGAFWMYEYLTAHGFTLNDVQAVNLQPADMVPALNRGDIDAFFAWEPFPYQAQRLMGDAVAVVSSEGIYTQTFNAVVLEKFESSNRPVLTKLVRALLAAEAYMRTNPEECITIVARHSNMDPAILATIWNDHKFVIGLEKDLIATLEKEGQWAVSSENVKAGPMPAFKSLAYPTVLRSVLPSRVTVD